MNKLKKMKKNQQAHKLKKKEKFFPRKKYYQKKNSKRNIGNINLKHKGNMKNNWTNKLNRLNNK